MLDIFYGAVTAAPGWINGAVNHPTTIGAGPK